MFEDVSSYKCNQQYKIMRTTIFNNSKRIRWSEHRNYAIRS